jgi:hemolysin activation/secretion protein
MAEGIRGSVWKFNYDFFVSEPLSRPKRFPGSHVVLGFDASLSF